MANAAAKFELDRAFRERDIGFLCDQISNDNLTPEVRKYLAQIIRGILTGEASFAKHRPKAKPSSKNTWKIGLRVLDLRRSGWPKLSAAVKQAATEFGCSDRKVYACLKDLRKVLRQIENDDWYETWREEQREEERREERRREEEEEEERRHEEALEEERWQEALLEEEGI